MFYAKSYKEVKNIYEYYRNKYVVVPKTEQCKAWGIPRDKHATISVITHRQKDFTVIDEYIKDCEQQFDIEYIKPMNCPTEQAWTNVMKATNAQLNNRGKNIVLECLQFGGNHEFWDNFPDPDEIWMYFQNCYKFAVNKIGFLHTDKNIICAVIVTEPNRRNLFVYYLPITETWQAKIMSDFRSEFGNKLQMRDEANIPLYRQVLNKGNPRLSHSEFWKARGGLTSYSDLQEDFYEQVSKHYGAVRGESLSLIKNTTIKQRQRFNRHEGDKYDELYFDDSPF